MIALYFYARIFKAQPRLPVIRQATPEARSVGTLESTVVYLALEEGDTLNQIGHCLGDFVRTRGRCALPLILHSFNHLSNRPMALNDARKLYEALPERIYAEGIRAVEWTTFGWVYELLIQDIGEIGSKGRIVCPHN
ncbi:MAG: hypothetical protein M1294_03395 [Firmicutes bacterium]|jgi:hypothetical protein|uniref:Threonyl-tRNA synthetase editing domain-containing protein n=1 Tax=Sulfobacillus benefaciens TaxID=453960 RepID=A0A2T2XB71_9FIRM|nr:hypothetical protein [Bacillota bacterium]MCL5015796.1 hypothetical protein [Bacillota bacterium]PSR31745.1 MAG: hypothetical protein C7B43_00525 [Sulfobacillus benefaciens]HBQ93882.1 hypothetical protein [Sulfobacillus sp.]